MNRKEEQDSGKSDGADETSGKRRKTMGSTPLWALRGILFIPIQITIVMIIIVNNSNSTEGILNIVNSIISHST